MDTTFISSWALKSAAEVAAQLNATNIWDPALIRRLVWLADMEAEYDEADGDDVESVIYAAAEKLGVSI